MTDITVPKANQPIGKPRQAEMPPTRQSASSEAGEAGILKPERDDIFVRRARERKARQEALEGAAETQVPEAVVEEVKADPFEADPQKAFSRLLRPAIKDMMGEGKMYYGLGWDWLANPNRFRLHSVRNNRGDDGIIIEGILNNQSSIQGDCKALALNLARDLQKQKGQYYRFEVVPGKIKGVAWERHFFILAWPHGESERIEAQLKNNPDGRIPPTAWVIDPTYRLAGRGDEDGKAQGYSLLDEPAVPLSTRLSETRFIPFPEEGEKITDGIPIGFMRDFLDGYKQPDDVALVYFRREAGTNRIVPLLGSLETTDKEENWREFSPHDRLLWRVFSLLEEKLGIPAPLTRKEKAKAFLGHWLGQVFSMDAWITRKNADPSALISFLSCPSNGRVEEWLPVEDSVENTPKDSRKAEPQAEVLP